MNKNLICCLFAVGMFVFVNAQEVKFGFKGGLNFASLINDTQDLQSDTRTGYHLGAVLQVSVLKTFAVQGEILYSAQGTDQINIDYINVPILAKLKLASIFSIEAGPQFGFLVNDDLKDIFFNQLKSEPIDFSFALGAGVEFGAFFGQIRYNIGITDVVENSDSRHSNFQLSVGYYIF